MHKQKIVYFYWPFSVIKEHWSGLNSVLLGITSGTDFAIKDFFPGRLRRLVLNLSAMATFAYAVKQYNYLCKFHFISALQ